jgi:hypothetical protein
VAYERVKPTWKGTVVHKNKTSFMNLLSHRTIEGKTVPLQAWRGREVTRNLKLPNFMTAQECGKLVSSTHRPPLPPRKYSVRD